jgi:ZIP family zinc transporter
MEGILGAFGWAALAASTLVFGALAGLFMDAKRSWVGLMLAFGAGALFSAVAFELAQEAFQDKGPVILAAGLAAGALTYFAGNAVLHRRGGARRGKRVRPAHEAQGLSIVLGAMLDGIPESIVLGSMLLVGGAVSPAFFAAVLLSNVPEGFSAAADLRREGHKPGWIVRLWVVVVIVSGLASAIAYAVLNIDSPAVALVQAFAAGGLLTMLVDTMIPEAHEDAGDSAGLATVLGFALAFLISALT